MEGLSVGLASMPIWLTADNIKRLPRSSTVEALLKEIVQAKTKFPGSERLMAALLEEVGELAEELLKDQWDYKKLVAEALQVACVAVRVSEELEAITLRERRLSVLASELGQTAREYLECKELHSERVSSC